jgi:FAD dependent oxidoreductase
MSKAVHSSAPASRVQRVAVLGAGIMGSCLSLFLARKGIDVTLFDMAPAPMCGASRWNEGKIHLGYIYSADPSLRTTRRLVPGGLAFDRLVSDLLGESLAGEMTEEDDLFLVHKKSVVEADHVHRYLNAVSEYVRELPDADKYLCDASKSRVLPLSRAELDSVADTRNIVAGFRVPERSVRTGWVADRLCAALAAEQRVSPCMGVRVTSATPIGPVDGSWRVRTECGAGEVFDVVVNALWHGRLAIDCTAGLAPEGKWSNRYRVSIFARTSKAIDVPSTIAVTGPFGDIKNYNGRDFYLSWYPAGLISESTDLLPKQPPPLGKQEKLRVVEKVIEGLNSVLPGASEVTENAENVVVEGGFVFAVGQGSIGDRHSSLHRRDRFGIQRNGRYFSVDTGKYSTSPWLADALSREIACG